MPMQKIFDYVNKFLPFLRDSQLLERVGKHSYLT